MQTVCVDLTVVTAATEMVTDRPQIITMGRGDDTTALAHEERNPSTMSQVGLGNTLDIMGMYLGEGMMEIEVAGTLTPEITMVSLMAKTNLLVVEITIHPQDVETITVSHQGDSKRVTIANPQDNQVMRVGTKTIIGPHRLLPTPQRTWKPTSRPPPAHPG